MSTLIGRKITTDSIVLNLDFSNRKCFVPNLLNYSNWQVGSGAIPTNLSLWGASSYSINGQNTENIRATGSNPFQYSNSVIWKGYSIDNPDISGGGDGGFDTGYVQIDPNRMYRYSIWTKRDYMTPGPTQSGQFYFGHRTYDSSYNLQNLISKTTNSLSFSASNTYFHATPNTYPSNYIDISTPYLGGLNVWTLVVAHVWPVGSTHGVSNTPGTNINSLPANSSHPDSGVWTIQNGKIGNLLYATSIDSGYNDWIWNATSSYTKHRAYHYYSGDITATQSFIYPRIDIVDGLEPTIEELLAGPEPIRDLSPNQNVLYPLSTTDFDTAGRGLNFRGTEAGILCGTMSATFSAQTVSIWFSTTSTIGANIPGMNVLQFGPTSSANNMIIAIGEYTGASTNEVVSVFTDLTSVGGTQNMTYFASSTFAFQAGVWYNLVLSWSGTKYLIYINGVEVATLTGGGGFGSRHAALYTNVTMLHIGSAATTAGGIFYPYGSNFNGKIGSVIVYQRSLYPHEILADFNSMKKKYGLI